MVPCASATMTDAGRVRLDSFLEGRRLTWGSVLRGLSGPYRSDAVWYVENPWIEQR
jgi:hypothetical protein